MVVVLDCISDGELYVGQRAAHRMEIVYQMESCTSDKEWHIKSDCS